MLSIKAQRNINKLPWTYSLPKPQQGVPTNQKAGLGLCTSQISSWKEGGGKTALFCSLYLFYCMFFIIIIIIIIIIILFFFFFDQDLLIQPLNMGRGLNKKGRFYIPIKPYIKNKIHFTFTWNTFWPHNCTHNTLSWRSKIITFSNLCKYNMYIVEVNSKEMILFKLPRPFFTIHTITHIYISVSSSILFPALMWNILPPSSVSTTPQLLPEHTEQGNTTNTPSLAITKKNQQQQKLKKQPNPNAGLNDLA